jgi:photosystem II stability/assembly factor-like uncharacterized protein
MKLSRVNSIVTMALWGVSALSLAQGQEHKTVRPLPITEFKLLTPNTGWVSSGNLLLMTSDAGRNWRNISPHTSSLSDPREEKFSGVYFSDPKTGWLLYATDADAPQTNSRTDRQPDIFRIYLASTTDGGETWTTVSRIPTPDPWQELTGGGSVFFVDGLHGWVDVGTFRAGVLYATSDGGKSWQQTHHGPGVAAEMTAPTKDDLWLMGGAEYQLFVSRNAGETVQKISIPTPSEVPNNARSIYSVPQFKNSTHGFDEVTYVSGETSTVVLFETTDSGRTWKEDRRLTGFANNSDTHGEAPAILGTNWLVSFAKSGDTPALFANIKPGEIRSADKGMIGDSLRCRLSFSNLSVGWALCSDVLFLTISAGSNWTPITPRTRNGELTTDPVAKGTVISPVLARKIDPTFFKGNRRPVHADVIVDQNGLDQHLGFDKSYLSAIPAVQNGHLI